VAKLAALRTTFSAPINPSGEIADAGLEAAPAAKGGELRSRGRNAAALHLRRGHAGKTPSSGFAASSLRYDPSGDCVMPARLFAYMSLW
jgi:hypothetical protein